METRTEARRKDYIAPDRLRAALFRPSNRDSQRWSPMVTGMREKNYMLRFEKYWLGIGL